MPQTKTHRAFAEELAQFLASRPTRQQLLQFRPAKIFQQRAEGLLQKQNDGEISYEERQELEEFAHAERLLRLIKAQLRVEKAVEL